MSLPTDRRTTTRPGWIQGRRDAGFSLVEVVVAIGILGLLIVATLPSVIGGIKATDFARKVGQGKSVVQAEVERMRNLPFWVARNAGDFVDVLDRYYPDQVAPTASPTCGSAGAWKALVADNTGYVTATGSTARCAWEPQAGPMYRRVITGATSQGGAAEFVLVVNTQFLTDRTPPAVVTPPAGWTTKLDVVDRPPARQLRVTVTALPTSGTVRTPIQSTTQISRNVEAVPRIRAAVDVVAVDVGTSVKADVEVPLDATAGVLQLRGATDYASTVEAALSSVAAAVGSGDGLTGRGATTTAAAPPSTTGGGVDSVNNGALDPGGCALVCWGGTRTTSLPVSAADGLPQVGSASSPVATEVKVPSTAGGQAFQVGAGSTAAYLPVLSLGSNLLRMGDDPVDSSTTADCQVGGSGPNVRVGASGWLASTARTGGSTVDACGTARTAPVSLLPTTFAPAGLLRVQLTKASARCTVSGTSHAAATAYDYAATVSVWNGGNDYRQIATVTPTVNGLASVSPADVKLPDGRSIDLWFRSWSGLDSASVVSTTSGGVAEVRLPGVVTVLTQPLRSKAGEPTVAEPASTLSLTVGTVSCRAEDRR